MKVTPPTITSPKLEELLSQKMRVEKALTRCRKAIASIGKFHESLDVKHVQALRLAEVQQGVAAVAEDLDEKLLRLEEKFEELTKAIEEERKVLGEVKVDDKLLKQVSITVFAERDCEVELLLIYGALLHFFKALSLTITRFLFEGVTDATWDATYDIYVKTDTKEKAVTFIYKAAILQNTGEVHILCPLISAHPNANLDFRHGMMSH